MELVFPFMAKGGRTLLRFDLLGHFRPDKEGDLNGQVLFVSCCLRCQLPWMRGTCSNSEFSD